MPSLRFRTPVAAAAIALAFVPGFAYAQADTPAKKEVPGGRSRLNPKTGDDVSQLAGTPTDGMPPPAPSMHGFGPMSGNPLLALGIAPIKSN
jgi:hypothetical protein